MRRLEETQRPLIYLIKLGRFSNTNVYLEDQLRLQFPDAFVRTVDLQSVFKRPSWILFKALVVATVTFVLERVVSHCRAVGLSATVLRKLLRDPAMFALMSTCARRAIHGERQRVWFTIQTQSLWNGAVAGIPHFVYTDSTILANLYFKRPDFTGIPSAAWLDCERAIYADATRVFVMSAHVGRSLRELYGIAAQKVSRVGVGANLKQAPASPRPAPAGNKTILFLGMEWERKGGPDLIDAFQRLPGRHSDARLLIVGVAPHVDAAHCEVVGRVPPEAVADYYSRAAIFCMPTRLEPFGIAFIEAMMHSVAVVAPRHGAMLDYVNDGETGVLFTPGDPEDIARALTGLLDRPAERQGIARRGFDAARAVYTWEAVGRRLRREILSSVSRRSPPVGRTNG